MVHDMDNYNLNATNIEKCYIILYVQLYNLSMAIIFLN